MAPEPTPYSTASPRSHGWFYLALAVGYTVWWILLFTIPAVGPYFLGSLFASRNGNNLFLLDVNVILLSFYESNRVLNNTAAPSRAPAIIALLVLVGAIWSLVIAVREPIAVWGFYAMVLASTLTLCLLIAQRHIPIVWGPFRFRRCPTSDPRELKKLVAGQITMMWTIFLVVLPLGLSWAEKLLGWDLARFSFPGQIPLGLGLAIFFGCIGIAASRAMIFEGDGTPLPVQGTHKLVVGGPYAYVRNPMAVTAIAQGLSVGLALGSGAVLIYSLCGAMIWDLCIRPLEEEYLAGEFGADYLTYRNSVPCWRVRFRPFQPPG